MKKKLIIAALLAGVVAATCLTGYTCDFNSGDGKEEEGQQQEQGTFEKGVEVTVDEWTAAINANKNVQNCSMFQLHKETYTVTGEYIDRTRRIPLNLKSEWKGEAYGYYDFSNNIWCVTASQTDTVSGFADLYALDYVGSEDIEVLRWTLPGDLWDAKDKEEIISHDEYTVKIDEKVYAANKSSDETEWEVRYGQNTDNFLIGLFNNMQFATEENGEEKPLTELYKAFVYSDGVYTADLWSYGEMYTYSVSFKDGYVLSIGAKVNKPQEEQDGMIITFSGESRFSFYGMDKTTVKPAPDAVKAVEDYIKENS